MRPAERNALNREVVRALSKALDKLEKIEGVRTIVFEGLGGDFGVGVDLKFFVRNLRTEKKLRRILDFIREGLELFDRIAALKRKGIRTIAVVDGVAFGGGFEMALAVGEIIATEEAKFAFPETTQGIVPSFNGGVRLAQLIGPLPSIDVQFTTSAQKPITGVEAWKMGIAHHLVSRRELDRILETGDFPPKDLSAHADRVSSYWRSHRVMEERTAWGAVALMLARRSLSLGSNFPAESFPDERAVYERIFKESEGRPPTVLEKAVWLTSVNSPFQGDVLRELHSVFSDPIALEGISAAVERRDPDFARFEKRAAPVAKKQAPAGQAAVEQAPAGASDIETEVEGSSGGGGEPITVSSAFEDDPMVSPNAHSFLLGGAAAYGGIHVLLGLPMVAIRSVPVLALIR